MKTFLAALLLFSAAAPALASQIGYTTTETELKIEPTYETTLMETLAENSRVVALPERFGGWLRVKAESGKTGWVRMAHVKLELLATQWKGFGALFSGGLASADIKKARPNPAELQKMQRYVLSKDEARQFAKRVKLREQKVEYISALSPEEVAK